MSEDPNNFDPTDEDPRWPHRFDIRDGKDSDIYLTRWTLLRLFGWSLKLHCIRKPDHDRCAHDHPWSFWTFVLYGGYEEVIPWPAPKDFPYLMPDLPVKVGVGRLYHRPAEYRHRITKLPRGSAWTLVVTSPARRDWGFWVKNVWIHQRDFLKAGIANRVAWCGNEGLRTPMGDTSGDNS